MIDRKYFFDTVRNKIFSKLKASQVEGIELIFDEWEKRKLTNLDWLAYILATVHWETARTFQPIAEYGYGKGRKYGTPDPKTGKTYYGRGYVQLTWAENYKKMGQLLGIDLYKNPELALKTEYALAILFEGMLKAESGVGDFTNVSLEQFFDDSKQDWIGARKIINGTDHASEIADLAKRYRSGLREIKVEVPAPKPVAKKTIFSVLIEFIKSLFKRK